MRKIYRAKKFIVLGVSILLILALAVSLNYKTRGVFFNTEKKLPVYCVDTEEKKVAISFDASWGANNTENILDILDEYDAKATFFLVGRWIDEFPEETKEIFSRGHEIGNHSNTHPDFVNISSEQIAKEINETDDKLIEVIGEKTKLFRFPSGSYNNRTVEAVENTGHNCIQWDVDSIDWMEQGASMEYQRVMKKVKPGSIVLFHNAAKYTPENLPKILSELKSQGYEFVTISELIYENDYYIDYSGKQIKKND